MTLRHIVVAGAGAAGLSAVESLRREGYGGRVTVVGSEAELPYDRPPLSKGYLSGGWDDARLLLRTGDVIDALEADWILGRSAVALDQAGKQLTLDDGSTVPFDAAVIATGVRARTLPGSDGVKGVHVLRTLTDARRLREEIAAIGKLLVVGGGFLGSEAAATARELGAEVTLISRRPTPLFDLLGDEVAGMLADVHRERGVGVEHGTVAALMADDEKVAGVQLMDGREFRADTVLLAIGSLPNTEWLAGTGLDISDGVVCDAEGRAATGVWAVGDVAAWWDATRGRHVRIEHRTNATEHGMSVARSILGSEPLTTVPYVWSDQYEYKVQIHGSLRGADRFAVVDGSVAERKFTALYGRDGRVCAAVGVNMIRPLRALRGHVAARSVWENNAAHPAS